MPYSTPYCIIQRPSGTLKLLSVTGCVCLDRLGYGVLAKQLQKSQWLNIIQVYFLLMLCIQCRSAGRAHNNDSRTEGGWLRLDSCFQSHQDRETRMWQILHQLLKLPSTCDAGYSVSRFIAQSQSYGQI